MFEILSRATMYKVLDRFGEREETIIRWIDSRMRKSGN